MSGNKQNTNKMSKNDIPNKSIPINDDHLDGFEETEIIAGMSVPSEGGWGWVVVLASFSCCFVLDGVLYTFGSIYKDMTNDLGVDGSLVALLNSIAVALYFICGPITSAFINRFGFRECTMSGSILLSSAFLFSYFSTSYIVLLLFYGILAGLGSSLVYVPSLVVVGFYFERLRCIALALAGLGSSMGIMIMSVVNSYFVNLAGWRLVTLIHSGLFGTIYFIAMAYRPLVVITLTQTTDTHSSSRTVTYLPSLTKPAISTSKSKESIRSTITERRFSAVANPNYPTASSVVQANQGGTSNNQKHRPQSKVSVLSNNKDQKQIEVAIKEERRCKRKWWAKYCCCCCKWQEQVQESRPMYRDDAFYQGKIEDLPVYKQSVGQVKPEERTGLEYRMSVTRVATSHDLEERKGVFTTALRRVLATMMDPQLLKRSSFLLLCCSALLIFIGYLTPYVFLPDRARSEGIDEVHCNLFVSVIGLCNAIGRLLAGMLATKFKPLKLYIMSCIITGMGTMGFNFLFDVYYQYFCCAIFGVFTSCIMGTRSIVLVDSYGLEHLTNATGMIIMFQGFGSLISSPLSGILKDTFGYAVPFYMSGTVFILSGIILLPIGNILRKETNRQRLQNKTNSPETQQNNLGGKNKTSDQEKRIPKK